MPTMGRYCKAYTVARLREFPGWKEPADRQFNTDDYLFLQENFVVTEGIFKDENIRFDEVTDDWKAFCQDQLAFAIPDYNARRAPVESESAISD